MGYEKIDKISIEEPDQTIKYKINFIEGCRERVTNKELFVKNITGIK